MSILVTGANGCIGNILVRFLVGLGYEVIALVLDENDTDKIKNIGIGNVKFVFGDICDKEKMEAIFSASIFHIVIHLAGIVHNPDATLEECMAVNYKATSDLFDLSKKYGVKQFIFASSVAIYGDDVENVMDEYSPVNPQTPYALSKLKAEEYIKSNHDNKIEYTIVRPTTVYGKYDRGNINRLFSIAKKGFVPIIGDGNNRKSFVYVENLVEGIGRVILNPDAYEQVFILSDAEPYSVNRVLKEMEMVIGKKIIIVHLPASIILFAMNVMNGLYKMIFRKEFFSISSITKLVTNNVFDISKARRVLNFTPLYTLTEGLQKIYGTKKIALRYAV